MRVFWGALYLMTVLAVAMPSGTYADAHQPPAPPPMPGATPPPLPPPPPPPQQLKVFVASNGQVTGPFNQEQLKAKIAAGELNRQTLVWIEGMADWQAAATVAAVAPLLTAVPPEPQFDAAAYQVGTWEHNGTLALPDGSHAQFSESTTYRTDGTLSGFGTLTSQTGYGPLTMNIKTTGTWKADVKSDNSFILTLNITVNATSAYGVPSVETTTKTILFTIIDRNTVANKSGSRRYRVGN